jgi:hypothetical protein
MKTTFKFKAVAFFLCAFLASTVAFGQGNIGKDGKPIPSPRDTVSGTAAGATITIAYGSPAVKGRVIFGEGTTALQPYGTIWRAGANQMTIFTTNKDIMVQGKKLPAGTYSLFATPGEKEFTIIFNSVTGQWGIHRDGTANDDPSKDVLVVKAKATKSNDITERLTYKISDAGFSLVWEHVSVWVSIK